MTRTRKTPPPPAAPAPRAVAYAGPADLLILGPDDGLSGVLKFPRGVPVEVTPADHALLLASSRAHQLHTGPVYNLRDLTVTPLDTNTAAPADDPEEGR